MTEKIETFDVWVVPSNTVYRDVPYSVVTDWLQQGRLIEDDNIRPTGTFEWRPIAESKAFAAFLAPPMPNRVEDQAEALEPVQFEVAWPRSTASHDDDDDVDMIPLIDVSLVLLIFFMMTATVAGMASPILTPKAGYGSELSSDPGMLWIGVELAADKEPFYSFGRGNQPASPEDRQLGLDGVMRKLDEALREGAADVRVRAQEETPLRIINRLRSALEPLRRQGRIRSLKDEVREDTAS
jgi:biopolymer transport protein ExbD